MVSDASFERRQRRVLADDLRDHLIERRGHVRAGGAGVRTRALSQVAGVRPCDTEPAVAAFSRLPNDDTYFLYGSSDARIGLSLKSAPEPLGVHLIHRRTVRRVAHDRAVGNVEEAGAHLRRRGGLGERRGGRHHRIQERQRQRDAGAPSARFCEKDVSW